MSYLNKFPNGLLITAIIVASLILMVYFLSVELDLTGGLIGVPLDDAWIHFQFARNISHGSGFSFNPGEPTPGSTAPLWTFLLAAFGLLGGDFMESSLLLSALFFLATIVLTYGFSLSLLQSRFAALMAALGVALTGRLLWASLSGMETTAFAAISVAAAWSYYRWGLRVFTAVLFGLASQLRPIGHALFLLAILDSTWQLVEDWRRTDTRPSKPLGAILRYYLPPVAIYALVAAPYTLFALTTTGRPLPNTFYAKVGSEQLFSMRTLRETLLHHWQDNPISILLIPFGLLSVWRRMRLVVLWLIAMPLLAAFAVDFVWHHGRYTMPLVPFQMIVAAAGAIWLLRMIGNWQSWSDLAVRLRLVALPAILLVLALGLAGWARVPSWATMLARNVNEIQEIDVALGNWLANNTPEDALLAVDDIGAITYLSERRIVDMNGLVSPEMWPAIREEWGLPRNQSAARILSQASPEFMIGFPLWHWEIATNSAVAQPVHKVETNTHTIIAEPEAFVYQMSWPYLQSVSPEFVRDDMLGDAIKLLGYDLSYSDDEEHSLVLTNYWQSVAPVAEDYDVFVHVLNQDGEIVAQVDQQPLQGLTATSIWKPGDIVRDPHRIVLSPGLAAGSYTISTGLFLRDTGERLKVMGDQAIEDAIILTSLELP